jgi:hypothetical protein
MRLLRLLALAVVLNGVLLIPIQINGSQVQFGRGTVAHAVVANEDEGFPPCDAAHDGDVYVDGVDGQIWYCQYVAGAGWVWVPKMPSEEYASGASFYNGLAGVLSYDLVPDGQGASTVMYGAWENQSDGSPAPQPPGYIASEIVWYIWDDAGQFWAWCDSPADSTYNSTTTFFQGLSSQLPNPECGAGYYISTAAFEVYDPVANAWDTVFLPTSPTPLYLGAASAPASSSLPPKPSTQNMPLRKSPSHVPITKGLGVV